MKSFEKEVSMSYDNVATEELEERVRARRTLVEKYIQFVDDITLERGKVVYEHVSNYYAHMIRQLEGLAGFSFLADTGQSEMGGDDYKVWYHPTQSSVDLKSATPVLSVTCHANLEVLVFDESSVWQVAFDDFIARKEEIIGEIDRKAEEEKQAHAEQMRIANEESRRTLQEAERLKV